jgi:hypothetical protein
MEVACMFMIGWVTVACVVSLLYTKITGKDLL